MSTPEADDDLLGQVRTLAAIVRRTRERYAATLTARDALFARAHRATAADTPAAE